MSVEASSGPPGPGGDAGEHGRARARAWRGRLWPAWIPVAVLVLLCAVIGAIDPVS